MPSTLTGLNGQSSLYGLISQMSQIYQVPVRKLEVKKMDLEQLSGVHEDVKEKLSTLRTTAQDLADTISPPLEARTSTTGNDDVVTTTATNAAAVSSHSIKVTQLARSHTMVSDQVTSDSTSIATALGAGTYTFDVTVDEITKSVSVDVAADDTDADVMTAVAYAITEAWADEDEPVVANAITDTSTTTKMTIKSGETGTDNKMTLSDTSGLLLAQIGIDDESAAATGTTGGYIYADSELDANLTVDGVSITRGSNTLDDIITGVTLTLRGEQEAADAAVDVNITADTDAIKTTLQEFLDEYNDVVEFLNLKTKTDADTGARGMLASSPMYRLLLNDLRATVGGDISVDGSGEITMLSQLGIEANTDGTLYIDDDTDLTDNIEASQLAVSRLFNSTDGLGNLIDDLIEPFSETGGYLDMNKDGLEDRISYYEDRIDRAERRAEAKEKRLVMQYSRLQGLMAEASGFTNLLGMAMGVA
jgi:flagellar hook-associated protein 2